MLMPPDGKLPQGKWGISPLLSQPTLHGGFASHMQQFDIKLGYILDSNGMSFAGAKAGFLAALEVADETN